MVALGRMDLLALGLGSATRVGIEPFALLAPTTTIRCDGKEHAVRNMRLRCDGEVLDVVVVATPTSALARSIGNAWHRDILDVMADVDMLWTTPSNIVVEVGDVVHSLTVQTKVTTPYPYTLEFSAQ